MENIRKSSKSSAAVSQDQLLTVQTLTQINSFV